MKKGILLLFLILICFTLFACSNKGECTITCDDIYLLVGETHILQPQTNVSKAKFEYTVEGDTITINNNIIKGEKIGTSEVEIKVKGYNNSIKIKANVVEEGILLEGPSTIIVTNQAELKLLKFGISDDETVTWRSSDTNIASVRKGLVTTIGLGKVTITAKVGIYTEQIEIEVIRPDITEICVDTSKNFEVGATYTLSYTVKPEFASTDVTITSNNENVKVNADNTISALNEGLVTLLVTSKDNKDIKKEVTLEVLKCEKPKFEKTSEYKELLEINAGDTESLTQGLKVIDNADGDITSKITCEAEDISKYGERTVKLIVKDNAGNVQTFERKVKVVWNYHTKVIGHRGCIYGVPNSEKAYLYAASELHYQALECDVKQTKDGVFVISHDEEFLNKTLSNTNYADIKNLEKTSKSFGLPKEKGLAEATYVDTICTLERYLQICHEYGCEAIIELKDSKGITNSDQSRLPALIKLIKDCDMWEDTIFLTSMTDCLKWFRNNGYNDIRLQYLVNSIESESILKTCIDYNFDISTNVTYGGSNGDEWIKRYHEAGLEISTWTFTSYCDYDQVQEWIDKGVEYVTCDWHHLSELNFK